MLRFFLVHVFQTPRLKFNMVLYINHLVHLLLNKMLLLNIKNRHLLEVAHILLIHMWIPKQFWGVVIINCYLINRMLLCVLDDKIPYSILCPQTDLFLYPAVLDIIDLDTLPLKD